MMNVIKVLAITGSLRVASSNTALLQAAVRLAPAGVEITLYTGLGDLPHFNPDLEGKELPTVHDFRAQLQAADGLLISSPEYAHGLPGVLKNALDWVVGSGETFGKPFALFNASPRATHAQASLHEVLVTMAAVPVPAAFIAVPLLGSKLGAADIVANADMAQNITAALTAFAQFIQKKAA